MATTKKAAPKKGFQGVRDAIWIIVVCFGLAVAFYEGFLGNGANFHGGDNSGEPANLLGTIYKGGIVVPVIFTLLFTVIALGVERFFALRSAFGKMSLAKYEEMEKTTGVKKSQKIAKIQQAHEEATQLEMPTLQMNLPIVATIVTLGTLTALFGTVVGMIRSFAALAAGGGADSQALSTGISEALVNTASGILTSWFAVVIYNFFTNKIDKLTYALDEVGYTIAQTYEANHGEEA